MAAKVRYRVLAPCFVNGSLHQPDPKKAVYVFADDGLEGKALKLDPETPPAATAPPTSPPAAPKAAPKS